MPITHVERFIGLLEIATGIGIYVFWLLFFGADFGPSDPPLCYFQFEHAFVFPDLFLAGALLTAGVLLLRGKNAGIVTSLPAGGALIFLGGADTSFNSLNSIYSHTASQAIENIALNMWCLGFGAVTVAVSFRSIIRNGNVAFAR